MNDYDVWIGGDYNIDRSQPVETKCVVLTQFAAELNLQILIDTCTRPVGGTVIDNSYADNVVFKMTLPVFICDYSPVLALQKKRFVLNFVICVYNIVFRSSL